MNTKEITRRIAGRTMTVVVPAELDPEHGLTVAIGDLVRAELEMASMLALEGPMKGAAFKFMRVTLGLPAKDLARLLTVTPETVSRWENGARAVDLAAWMTLGALVLERAGKPTETMKRLDRLAARRK